MKRNVDRKMKIGCVTSLFSTSNMMTPQKKRHMLGVYFSASLALPLIIVFAWHLFSRLLPFFILLKINQTEKSPQVSMTSLLLCSPTTPVPTVFSFAHTQTHTHTNFRKQKRLFSFQSINHSIHPSPSISFPHLSLFPTLKVMTRLGCRCRRDRTRRSKHSAW